MTSYTINIKCRFFLNAEETRPVASPLGGPKNTLCPHNVYIYIYCLVKFYPIVQHLVQMRFIMFVVKFFAYVQYHVKVKV